MSEVIDYDLKDLRGEKVYFKYILNSNDNIKCKMYHRKTLNLSFYKIDMHFRITTNNGNIETNVGRIDDGISKADYYRAACKLLNQYNEYIEDKVKEETRAIAHKLKMKNAIIAYQKNKIDLAKNFHRQKGLIIKEAIDNEHRRHH